MKKGFPEIESPGTLGSLLKRRQNYFLMASQQLRHGHRNSAYLTVLTSVSLAANQLLRDHHFLERHKKMPLNNAPTAKIGTVIKGGPPQAYQRRLS
jgi:hypothetical protein